MALSDEVASLKVEVHKLAVAIEELTIKRYIKGEIDKSKLPWFTPQYVPGDSIKASGNRVPTAPTYLDNNEGASPTSSFLNARNTLLGAHQVFEKMPEPISSSNNDQVAVIGDHRLLNDIGEVQPSGNGVVEPYVDGNVPDYVRTAHKLFHTMPVPDFILEMAKAAKITHENEEITDARQVFDKIPQPISHLSQVQMLRTNDDNTRKHQIAGSSAGPCIKLAQNEALPTLNFNAPNGMSAEHDMFGKLPVPTFILEMAQAAKTMQENEDMVYAHQVFDTIPEPTKQANMSQTVCQAVVNVDHDNLLCGMILEPTCRYHFVFDPGVLFLLLSMAGKDPCLSFFDFKSGWQAKINYKEVHSWGKLYPSLGWYAGSTICLPHSHYGPVISSHGVNYIVEVVRFYAPNLRKLVLCVGVSLTFNACELLLVFIGFEEQLTTKWLQLLVESQNFYSFLEIMTTYSNIKWIKLAPTCGFSPTLEDKGDFRGEEGIDRECTWELFNRLTPWSNCIITRTNKRVVLVTYIFYPGGSYCPSNTSDIYLLDFLQSSAVSFTFHVGEMLAFYKSGQTPFQKGIYSFACSITLCKIYLTSVYLPLIMLLKTKHFWFFDHDIVGFIYIMLSAPKLFKENHLRVAIKWSTMVIRPTIIRHLLNVHNFVAQAFTPERNGVDSALLPVNYDSCPSSVLTGVHKRFAKLKLLVGFYESKVAYAIFTTEEFLTILWGSASLKCESQATTDLRIVFLFDPCGLPVYYSDNTTHCSSRRRSTFSHGSCFLAPFFATRSYEFFTEMTFSFFIFDLRGLYNLWIATLKSFLKVTTHVGCSQSSTVWIFDPGGNGNSKLFSETAKARTGTMLKMFLSMLLEYGTHIHYDTIFPFDPGGDGSGLNMIEPPQAYESGVKQSKDKGYDNFQIYVFDPGGPLTRLVIDAMARKSEPKKCCAMPLLHMEYITCL